MYLVSSYYRGAMNVSDMRSFFTKAKAKEYWESLIAPRPLEGTSSVRAYKMFEDKEPRLLRTEKHWEEA